VHFSLYIIEIFKFCQHIVWFSWWFGCWVHLCSIKSNNSIDSQIYTILRWFLSLSSWFTIQKFINMFIFLLHFVQLLLKFLFIFLPLLLYIVRRSTWPLWYHLWNRIIAWNNLLHCLLRFWLHFIRVSFDLHKRIRITRYLLWRLLGFICLILSS